MTEILIEKAPGLFGSEAGYLGFPSNEYFTSLAMPYIREQYPESEYPELSNIPEDEYWVVRNAISGKRDDYYRLRCRDAAVRYSVDGKTPESYETYMSHDYFASAFYAAFYDYCKAVPESTEQELHRQRLVFAGIINVSDGLQRGMPFLDPRLENDGLVRTKHFMGFLYRANWLAKYIKTPDEQAEYAKQYEGLQMAVAEIGAQNPVNLSRELELLEDNISDTNEHLFYVQARSKLLDLSDMQVSEKIRVVERYQSVARRRIVYQEADDFFLMQLLHLFGLATASDFYNPETHELDVRWFDLKPEELLSGEFSNASQEPSGASHEVSPQQDTLF